MPNPHWEGANLWIHDGTFAVHDATFADHYTTFADHDATFADNDAIFADCDATFGQDTKDPEAALRENIGAGGTSLANT